MICLWESTADLGYLDDEGMFLSSSIQCPFFPLMLPAWVLGRDSDLRVWELEV